MGPPAGQEVGVCVLHQASHIPHTPVMRLGMSQPLPGVLSPVITLLLSLKLLFFFFFIKPRFQQKAEVAV